MQVITERPPDSDHPAFLLDIYRQGREPFGEYYFYFATDASVVEGGKVNANLAKHSFLEAFVSFEADVLNVANIMHSRVAGGTYGSIEDGHAFLDERLDLEIGNWGEYQSYPVIGGLSFDQVSVTWFDFNRWGGPNLGFEFVKIDTDRVTSVRAVSTNPRAIPRALYDEWLRIVHIYDKIPYRRFTGASRM